MLELLGSSQVRETSLSPGAANRLAGEAGNVHADTSSEGVPSPLALFARTWKVYRTPLVSPVTV